jgi:hypothetical protein
MLQHITKDAGGTVYLDASERLTTPTVTVKTGNGDALVTGATATLEAISTTLSSAATKGDTTIAVTLATGITFGARIWIGGIEDVIVRYVSGTTLSLARPLAYSHASGSAVQSYHVSYAVSPSIANTFFLHGWCEWSSGGVLYANTPLMCTSSPIFSLTTLQNILDEDSELHRKLSPYDDPVRMLDQAWKDTLQKIGTKAQTGLFKASGDVLNNAVKFAFFRNMYRPRFGEGEQELYREYKSLFVDEIAEIVPQLAMDIDEDGQTNEDGERASFRTIRLVR